MVGRFDAGGGGGTSDPEYTAEDAVNDALSGDLAGDQTKTGTPPLAGTKGLSLLGGARGAAAALTGLIVQSNNRNIADVWRVQNDPGHAYDIPEDTWADTWTDATTGNTQPSDGGANQSPVAQVARLFELVTSNAGTIATGVVGLVLVYVVGQLFTFNVGVGD